MERVAAVNSYFISNTPHISVLGKDFFFPQEVTKERQWDSNRKAASKQISPTGIISSIDALGMRDGEVG